MAIIRTLTLFVFGKLLILYIVKWTGKIMTVGMVMIGTVMVGMVMVAVVNGSGF